MLHDLVAHLAVEVPGGLVGEQDPRIADDALAMAHALLLAARELRREVMDPRAEPDAIERLGAICLRSVARQLAVESSGISHVVEHA
mgnify:CR=1 FL=1